MNTSSSFLCDIHTGAAYRHSGLGAWGGIVFNTDGVSPFKSSRVTVWPMLIALSNLPPNIRWNKDNLIVSSLWVGETKPPMDTFFSHLTDSMHKLGTVGIKLATPGGDITVTFQPLFGSFDFVAKAPILSMHQFNGENGCPSCLHPGVWTTSRYYLPGSDYPPRTNAAVLLDAQKADETKCIVNGIKGKSVLSKIVDLVRGVPVDYMHCVLEGVTKWMLEKWVTSSSHRCAYYIGRSIKKIDSLLLDLHPPHDFSRAPRSISRHRKHWKASEFRNWLLYFSLPLLVSTLPPLYLHHFSLLVCAIHILLQSKLSEVHIQAAEEMLKDFYSMLPELYGTSSCTFNAHSLTHLTMYVRLWGPLWTHSLFGFESFNGHLSSMIHSKYRVAEQVSFSIDVFQTIGNLADKLAQTETDRTIRFIEPMSSSIPRHRHMMLILPGIYSIGKVHSSTFSQEEQNAIQVVTNIPTNEILIFHKLYLKDTILHSSEVDNGKRNSSICSYISSGEKKYGVVQKFCFSPHILLIKPFKKTRSSLLQTIGNPCRDRLRCYLEIDLLSTFIVQVNSELLPICAVSISDLVSKCVFVKGSTHSYVINIPNNFEHH